MLISSPPQVALLETSPYLLALTIIVSIVHSVFEFLAFKNGRHGGPGCQGNWQRQYLLPVSSPAWGLSPALESSCSWRGIVTRQS